MLGFPWTSIELNWETQQTSVWLHERKFFFLPACHSTLHSEVPTWKAGWDKLREWHWHLSVTMCQTDSAGTPSSLLCDDLEGRGGVGGRLQRKRVYVQLSLIHSVAQQKIQHCKAIILQFKKKKTQLSISDLHFDNLKSFYMLRFIFKFTHVPQPCTPFPYQ